MMWLRVSILTWLCNLRRPPVRGAQATSCFFPGSKYSGKFRFLACSGDLEPLVIYALTCPNLALYANKRSEKKKTKVSIKSLPSSVSLARGLWSFSEYRELNCNLFLEAWLENQASVWTSKKMENLAFLEKKTAKNIMKMDTMGHAWHSWFHVIFLATSWDRHCCLHWRGDC